MIFLDTSAIYALADARDANHTLALEYFSGAAEAGETFLVHNYVVVEAAALLQRRLGMTSALQFLSEANTFQVHWISSADHLRAVGILEERAGRGLTLVDCTSFVVMRQYGVTEALAFDSEFVQEGFTLYN